MRTSSVRLMYRVKHNEAWLPRAKGGVVTFNEI